jgi:hypothetical protein
MDGSATFVTLTSRRVMNIALQQTISAIHRPRLSSAVTARSCQSTSADPGGVRRPGWLGL